MRRSQPLPRRMEQAEWRPTIHIEQSGDCTFVAARRAFVAGLHPWRALAGSVT